jgi:ankyrin repeat protein
LALAIWSGFSVFQNGGETSAQVTSAYDFREIKDLKSVTITISESEYAFICCYHYSLSVHGDGRVEYYGHIGSLVPGLHRSRVSEAEILRLLDAFRAADFYSLHDESNLLVMDAPTFTIALSVDGRTKTVTDRSRESTAFHALMDGILEITHAQRWLHGTADTLKAVLADTENLNSADDEGRTVLMWACESADAAAVRELIRSGADVRAKDRQGRTAMMYAAARQSLEIVDALLHSDAGVNEQNSSGQTALHFAASPTSPVWSAFNPVADYPEPPTRSFWSSLFLRTEPNPEVVAHLLAAGADPNAVDFEGATPLMYAAEVGTMELLRALLAAGADVNAQDAEGRTALMYASDHCYTDSVRLLVETGADVTLKDTNGHTALKRVQRKPSKFRRRLCRTDRKQIISILRVARTSR